MEKAITTTDLSHSMYKTKRQLLRNAVKSDNQSCCFGHNQQQVVATSFCMTDMITD